MRRKRPGRGYVNIMSDHLGEKGWVGWIVTLLPQFFGVVRLLIIKHMLLL